nr:immunoglobulin heavy chain junction region [Mus musculus]MBK4188432.1 immunoglobulin heavy chain junction region [Mus musculus]MBK4188433.1 immunoglobulin heavy chain junction region [Mus musculus]MBK4188443.1 immunoglobulin heavy chain junction region [Mus musculus]MBK4188444.1 immunoglobulin heavy chain junction region [Mus musculus]
CARREGYDGYSAFYFDYW